MEVSLRRMRAEDIEQVIAIEREAFLPLRLGTSFKRELSNRYACYLVAVQPPEEETAAAEIADAETDALAVAERNGAADANLWGRMVRGVREMVRREPPDVAPPGDIAGYVGIWFQGNEAHITEIAVQERLRGNGIGELLLIGSVRAAMENGSALLTLEARVSNFIAQRLYEKYGFHQAGLRKAYYSDNREDAVIMTTRPIHSNEYRELFHQLQGKFLERWGEIRIEG